MIKGFRKDTKSPFKKYGDFFKKINRSVDKVYLYGFGYGKVDGIYIKEIVKRISPEATWYFTKFETEDFKVLRIKKIKLRNYGFKGDFGIYEG